MWFLVLVWTFFFSPWIFNHLHPIPSDIISGMYYPFIEQKLGPVAGIPVKNPILTDTVSQFWIWRNWAFNSLEKGDVAIWNPYSLSGQAMSPWFHTILFSPLNIFYLLFNSINAMSAIVASQLLLSLLFSYLFLKKVTGSALASVFGSLSFSFSSFFIGWLTWGTVSSTLSFIPLTLYSIIKIKESDHYGFKVILFISHLFALLSGHPQTYLYYLLIVGTYIIAQKLIKKTFFTLLLSLLSGSFVLLPSIDILNHSIRSLDQFVKSNNYGFIHPFEIISSLITPGFFGTPSTHNYWGINSNFQEKLVWFGIIPFTFCISWLLDKINSKKYTTFDKWLIFLFIFGILLSTKYPIGFLIYKLNIPLLSTSPAGRGFVITILASVIMATKHFSSGKKINFMVPFTIIGSLYLTIFIFKYFGSVEYSHLRISIRNLTLSSGLLFILFLCSFLKGKIFYIIAICLTLFDLLYFSVKYTPFTPSSYYFPKNDLLESIRPTNDYYRVEREKSELLPPNMWQAYTLSSSQGYDPTLSLSYLKYLQSEKLVIDPTRFIEWKSSEIPTIRELGVKYALVLKKDKDNHISPSGLPPKTLIDQGWKLYKETGSVAVMTNPNYKPMYELTKPGSLKLIKKTDNSWEFKISTTEKNNLIIFENNDNFNWLASINYQDIPISDYLGTFKSIELPKGEYSLHLRYINRPFLYGTYISFLSLITFIIYLYIIKRKHETNT
ncbi:MAG: hypothetical protein WC851_01105 [Candidatus Shapirobacteria bacterium]|jgi:hypothetical protein